MSTHRDHLKVVQGLLAKAQATSHEAEADAFMAKAQALMARYAIDEAMLTAEIGGTQAVTTKRVRCQPPYASAKASMYAWIAEANGCRAVTLIGSVARGTIEVYGYPTDLEHVEMLYTSLTIQATNAMLAEAETSRRFRHAFLLAFANRIAKRLREAHTRTRQDYLTDHTDSPAAVVLADRDQAVTKAYKEANPHVQSRKPSLSSGTGFMAGDNAGRNADIGAGQLRGRRAIGPS